MSDGDVDRDLGNPLGGRESRHVRDEREGVRVWNRPVGKATFDSALKWSENALIVPMLPVVVSITSRR